ncbi:MAG: TonB-dependent receptor [Bacteroidota bacterium]
MKKFILIIALLAVPFITLAQKTKISGTVRDATTGETIPGVNVVYAEGKGTVTDISGTFTFTVDKGDYTISVSYVGYMTQTKKVSANENNTTVDFALSTVTLSEVEVVADIAKTRETPVAFTTVLPAKLQEELGSQDLPMVLNSTPGVYATQQGGGDGDSRINIRGFSQRNVAVMIDGIPVNDMENSWVYWSNWFGLDAVTRNVQVQRGLGASKLAIPSVGGTMNIVTSGINSQRLLSAKQEVGSDGYLRSTLAYNSGKLKHGWGVTFAGSYKYTDGNVDEAWSKGWFYYLKVDKIIGKHIISISGLGAPQQHGQRPYKKPIATTSLEYARSLGVDSFPQKYYGLGERYNQAWGYLERYTLNDDKTKTRADVEKLNGYVNYFHKPMITLRDFWQVNEKLYISNIAYTSLGFGGGTSPKNTVAENNLDARGQVNWQSYYDGNLGPFSINPTYSKTEHIASQYIKSSVNNHVWYGLLSTINWKISKTFDFAGGIDLRSYRGSHFEQIRDLLGGDYVIENVGLTQGDNNSDSKTMHRVGDKTNYYYDGIVRWGGGFVQAEMKAGNWSAFLNVSGSYSGFKKIDYFAKKVIKEGDSLLKVGYSDTIQYNGKTFTRETPGLKYQESDWKWIPSYTIKGGVNYNLTESMNIFANLGYLTKARDFRYIYERNSINLIKNIRSEVVEAAELGYSVNMRKFAANLNGYYTIWKNKAVNPITTLVEGDNVTGEIPGIDARHMGVELDVLVKPLNWLEVQGLASLGDWIWTSVVKGVELYDSYQKLRGTMDFNAKGIHVDDAAQTQYAGSIRVTPAKGFYLKGQFTYFSRYYSAFAAESLNGSPETLDANGNQKDSWMIPAYYLVDAHAGYSFKVNKIRYAVRVSVLNLLDKLYISDAANNDTYNIPAFNDFDAKSASVFFGIGRRYTASFEVNF